ncbi:molybdopterin biosynthesis protein MoeA2 [Actinomyces denticolens]|nr:molybdopterin biosynthesis protein MoeA2 [Actinomyces denticolens]
MRTVAEHLASCLEIAQPAPPLDVVLLDAVGCVLAEDVVAEFDLPCADLAGLDGYAVRAADIRGATASEPARLDVIDAVRAGDTSSARLVPGTAMLIDSGAPLPVGADAVVPWIETDRGTQRVEVRSVVVEGENVRRRAEDVAAGTTVMPQGSRVSARQIALLAGVGRLRVKVRPAPRVVIVSIGDELVEPGSPRRDGSVYDANGHALATAVTDAGGRAFRVAAVPDELGALTETLEDQLVRADVLITTGVCPWGRGTPSRRPSPPWARCASTPSP